MGKAAALKEIARECSFLHDRDSFTEKILKRTTALFSADAIAVGNKKGLGFDTTFISHGYPAEYIINYCNLNHERRRSLLELYGSGPQRGYFSISASGFKLKEKYPDDYKARYVKHDIKDIVQTSFFDAKHELMGATGILTRSKDAFNEDETAAMDTITPHIYHAFRNYRRIVEAEILTTDSLDELLYGIVTTDTLGVVTYINAAARYITSLDTNDKIPGYLKKAADKLKADFTF
ncbi:MAG: hypothetical protein KAR06_06290, partial [Deltaproteobacteria bacterium]|nr:hypothetical protein [Deltaproteobacteria bacterium]